MLFDIRLGFYARDFFVLGKGTAASLGGWLVVLRLVCVRGRSPLLMGRIFV
jgi:hypothetical protein